MRIEKDFLGSLEVPNKVLYGIHTMRALENFPSTTPFHPRWYSATGKVKSACYTTIANYRNALKKQHPDFLERLRLPSIPVLDALKKAASEVAEGKHFDHFKVPAVQGGAGTSINLNINEIIANRALLLMGEKPGSYDKIDPIEAANLFQSTNDVIPTALIVAVMELLNELEKAINTSRKHTESLEERYQNTLRLSYTQLQQAVPGTYGQLFSGYSDALSRDWWRVSKAFERIKQVNLGGGATGTTVSIPRFYVMEVVSELKRITNLPLAQAENLSDATSNLDAFIEVHAIIKAHAVNLEKISNDLRLLSSGLDSRREFSIPARQTGSSIMPGKVNPVVPEFVISAITKIYANDQLISTLAGRGELDLNAFLPVLGDAMLNSLDLLLACNKTLSENCLAGIEINEAFAAEELYSSPAVTTALSPFTGYKKAGELARYMQENHLNIFEANKVLKILSDKKLEEVMKPGFLLKKGFTVNDIKDISDGEGQ